MSTFALIAGLTLGVHAAVGAGPAITPEQIEADWLRQDQLRGTGEAKPPIPMIVRRGRQLAEKLTALGADVSDQLAALEEVEDTYKNLPADARRQGYLDARWAVRRMALRNPLLDFEQIVFTKRVPPAFPHMSDQYYGWWSRPGGGLFILEGFKGEQPRVRCITEGWPEGSFLRPILSFDGQRVLFAHAKYYKHVQGIKNKTDKANMPEDAYYHIYEMNIDGSGVRRLTRGKYDDFDARYLPDGDIVFLSTRKGQAIQVTARAAAETLDNPERPNSYVRCGGDNRRPVPVFTMHRMSADGERIRPVSAFENFEWTPAVTWDGRIIYARWDYIDRFNGPFMSLWSTNPDGTTSQLVYGNFTKKPQAVFEARPVPGSGKLMFTAAAHHSNMGGSIVLLDRAGGTEGERPLTRLTPEVCFPETEGWPKHYYLNPWPLSEDYYLVAWSDKRLPPHTYVKDPNRNPTSSIGIYLRDALGNQTLLYRDPDISSMYPLPLKPRRRPAVRPEKVARQGPREGRFLLQDVYRGMPGVERGSIRRLRVVAVPPKVQPHMNRPVLGVSREDPGRYVLGTVPVERDGSAYFRVPSGVPVLFQALDAEGKAVQTMRSLSYVQPGETLSCIGCHEHRDTSPASGRVPLAAVEGPSRLRPGPDGSWPLHYDRLVQPVLDQYCVSCHRPGADDAKGARFDLTPGKSYGRLIGYGGEDLKKLAFERDYSVVGDMPARKSKLMKLIADGHYDVPLDAEARERLITWMDTYAHRQGSFSPGQEERLRQLKGAWSDLLAPR